MKMPDVRHWFVGREQSVVKAPSATPAVAALAAMPTLSEITPATCRWSPQRLEIVDALWGDGFQFPGGAGETLRLAKPLGLSAASSLLLVGAGSGGAPCCIANTLGGWVTGYESDPTLLAAASERSVRSGLARRAQIEPWDAESPRFEHRYFHHGLALEPLRDGQVESTLAALADGLKPNGHLVLLETVADSPLDLGDPVVAAWQRLDGRRVDRLPAEATVTRALGRLGFDVRIVEDVSRRHIQQVLQGWREALRGLKHAKPSHGEAEHLVNEAELWLLRSRLFRSNKLRLLRWHAIGKG